MGSTPSHLHPAAGAIAALERGGDGSPIPLQAGTLPRAGGIRSQMEEGGDWGGNNRVNKGPPPTPAAKCGRHRVPAGCAHPAPQLAAPSAAPGAAPGAAPPGQRCPAAPRTSRRHRLPPLPPPAALKGPARPGRGVRLPRPRPPRARSSPNGSHRTAPGFPGKAVLCGWDHPSHRPRGGVSARAPQIPGEAPKIIRGHPKSSEGSPKPPPNSPTSWEGILCLKKREQHFLLPSISPKAHFCAAYGGVFGVIPWHPHIPGVRKAALRGQSGLRLEVCRPAPALAFTVLLTYL